ncbi:hypothetical protein [Burkholderia gladioli]|uniref:hypothetical protein n=1 Tax=Burkholderia gladioli TaxID=28095 RepID=UPI0016407052|nr:hypothetical protein [Burkholderia gladioli]MBU9269264.1 hypothetical protein [Burkholderia gladioli]
MLNQGSARVGGLGASYAVGAFMALQPVLVDRLGSRITVRSIEERFLNISNFNPGDELTLGTDIWKICPLWNKAYTLGAERAKKNQPRTVGF